MENLMAEIRTTIEEHKEKGKLLKQEAAALRESLGQDADLQSTDEPGPSAKGKARFKKFRLLPAEIR